MGKLFTSNRTKQEVRGDTSYHIDCDRRSTGSIHAITDWADADKTKIKPVLEKFEAYCKPCENIPFERYCYNRHAQEPGEMYDQYRTALRQLAEGCDLETITIRPEGSPSIWHSGCQSPGKTAS